ncbi:MAG: ACT domain-containing protein, partial [Thermodesulfobacteriota bacterium]
DYPFSRLPVQGIHHVDTYDLVKAGNFGYVLKLIAQVKEKSGSLQAGVFPALINKDHMLAKVDGPFNAILMEGNAVGPIMLYGQGAGGLPTGSAVLSDIMTLVKRQASHNNTGFLNSEMKTANILKPELTVSRHYLRFTVQDRPGVLAVLARIMGEQNISIAQLNQTQEAAGQYVPVVLMTHAAPVQQIKAALQEIDGLDFVRSPTTHYRIL